MVWEIAGVIASEGLAPKIWAGRKIFEWVQTLPPEVQSLIYAFVAAAVLAMLLFIGYCEVDEWLRCRREGEDYRIGAASGFRQPTPAPAQPSRPRPNFIVDSEGCVRPC